MRDRLESGCRWLATLWLAVSLPACAPPIPSGGFEAPDPASKIYAAVRVAEEFDRTGQRPDRATLQQLVTMLGSADPAARFVASNTLKRVSGVDLGYQPSAPLPERSLAVARWRAWVESLPTTSTPGDRAA